ncbi:MAG: DUF86 domain-containing protein [Bacteroidales bacterium]|nr:DUF86 domain-containing protein [Bacteroidales bacterium]
MREAPRDKERLRHILEACETIQSSLSTIGFETIVQDPLRYFGLIKHIEIIGEAVYKLTKEFRAQHPEVEWQSIADLRHILVHDYYRINPEMLRVIVERDIPSLYPTIQKFLEKTN